MTSCAHRRFLRRLPKIDIASAHVVTDASKFAKMDDGDVLKRPSPSAFRDPQPQPPVPQSAVKLQDMMVHRGA